MNRTKRSSQSVEEIMAKFPKRWKKAENVDEIRRRAGEGAFKITVSKSETNYVWQVFYKYPEIFLFDDKIKDVKECYLASHTYMYGNSEVQEENFYNSIRKMNEVANEIYKDFSAELNPQPEDVPRPKEMEKTEENYGGKNMFESLFDDDFDSDNLVEESKAVYSRKLSASRKKPYERIEDGVRKRFEHDLTPIENFVPSGHNKSIKMLKDKKVVTLGDYMKVTQDREKAYKFILPEKEIREQFKHNILNYVNESLGLGVGTSEVEKNVEENKEVMEKTIEVAQKREKFEEINYSNFEQTLKNLPAKNFVKGSAEMTEISSKMSDYLKRLTDEYYENDLTVEEIDLYISNEIEKFHKLVDEKREEFRRNGAAVAEIKAKIDEGVNYKHHQFKPKEFKHSHNSFDNDREL